MKTNTTVKTLPVLAYSANATMSKVNLGQIDISDVPAGYYMVVLKNSATDSNLKVQKMELVNTATSVNENKFSEEISVKMSSNLVEVTTPNNAEINLYNISGSLIFNSFTNHANISVNKGVYLLNVYMDGKINSKKIVVL